MELSKLSQYITTPDSEIDKPTGIVDDAFDASDATGKPTAFDYIVPYEPYTKSFSGSSLYTPHHMNIEKFRKYFNNNIFLNPSTDPAFMETVAHGQKGGGELLGKSLAHTAATLVGETISGAGVLFDPRQWAGIFSESAKKFKRNLLMRMGDFISEGTREALPIHLTQKAQRGFALGDATWWASMFPTVASMAAAFIPSMGAMKAIKAIGKVTKLAKPLGVGGKYAKLGRLLEQSGSALMSRHIDTTRESFTTFDEQRERLMGLGFSEKDATNISAQMATRAQRLGYMNIAFDFMEWGVLLRTTNKIKRGISAPIAKALRRKSSKIGALSVVETATGKAATRAALKELGIDAAKSMFAEGADEFMIEYFQRLGIAHGEMKNGILRDNTSALDIFAEHAMDRHSWDEAFWGAFGGLFMIGARPLISKVTYTKKARLQDEQIASEIINRAEQLEATLKNIDAALAKGNVVEAEVFLINQLANLVDGSHQTGAMAIYEEMFENYKKASNEELGELGLSQDILSNSERIIEAIKRAEKTYETWMNVDHSTKDVQLTDAENSAINRTIAFYTFVSNEYSDLLAKHKDVDKASAEQMAMLQDMLEGEIDSIENLLQEASNITDNKSKLTVISKSKTSQALFKANQIVYNLATRLQEAQAQQSMLTTMDMVLSEVIKSYGSTVIDNIEKSAKSKEQAASRAMMEFNKTYIENLSKSLAEAKTNLDNIKSKVSPEIASKIQGISNTINAIAGRDNATMLANVERSIKYANEQITKYTDSNQLKANIEEFRTKAAEHEKEILTKAKREILIATTEAELTDIETRYAGFDLRTEIKNRKNQIKNETKVKDDRSIISTRKEKAKYDSMVEIANGTIQLIKDDATRAIYEARLNEITKNVQDTAESYKESTENVASILQEAREIIKEKGTPDIKTKPTKSPIDALVSEIITNTQSAKRDVRVLSELLHQLYDSRLSQAEILAVFPDVGTETSISAEALYDSIREQGLILANRLDEIYPLLDKDTLYGEELEQIALAMAHARDFELILRPHTVDFTKTSFGKMLPANRTIQEQLKILSAVLGLNYENTKGFENFKTDLSETQEQALGNLHQRLNEFKYVYEMLKDNKDDKSAKALGEPITRPIENVMFAIEQYITSLTKTEVKAVSFQELSELVYDSIKSRDGYTAMMEMLKSFYNHLHENNITHDLIKVEAIDATIDNAFYDNVAKDRKVSDADLYFTDVVHKTGVSTSFELFVSNPGERVDITSKDTQKRYEAWRSIKEGDKLFVRRNKDGRLQLYKGNLGLGLYLNEATTDRHGISYADSNGVFSSYIDGFTQGENGDYAILNANYDLIREIWKDGNDAKFKKLETSHPLVQLVLKAINNNRAQDNQLTRAAINNEMLRHIIAPIFYKIDQSQYDNYEPTQKDIEVKYSMQNSRLRNDMRVSNEYRDEVLSTLDTEGKGRTKRHVVYVSSLSMGERIYDNGEGKYGNLESEDNLLRRVPSTNGKLNIGVRNFTNRSAIVVDIRTGKAIQAENAKSIQEGGFGKSMFFVTEESNGKVFMHAVTPAFANNSKHISHGKGNEYGKQLTDKTISMLQDYAHDRITTEELQQFLRLYYGYNYQSQDTPHIKVKEYKDGNKVVQFKIGSGLETEYYGLKIFPNGEMQSTITSTLTDAKDVSFANVKRVHISQFNKQIAFELRDKVLKNIRRGVAISKTSNNDAIIASDILVDGKIVDIITGKEYVGVEGYIDFLVETGALATNLNGVFDTEGNPMSGFNPLGAPRSTMFVTSVNPIYDAVAAESKVKSKSEEQAKKGITTEDGVVNSLQDLDGRVMELSDFLSEFELIGENAVHGTQIMEHYAFVLSAIDGLYGSQVKVKYSHQNKTVLTKNGNHVNVLAQYENGQIVIYNAFFQASEGTYRINQALTTTLVHELLHDVHKGVRQIIMKKYGKMDTFTKPVLDVIAQLKVQIKTDSSLVGKTIPYVDSDGNTNEYNVISILEDYINAVESAEGDLKWEEAINYAFADLKVVQALNSVQVPASDRVMKAKSTFFTKLLDAIITLVNAAFGTTIELNKNSRLEQLVNHASGLGQIVDAAIMQDRQGKSFGLVRDTNVKNYALSDEMINRDIVGLYDAILAGTPTNLQLQRFESEYGSNLVRLREDAHPVSLLDKWNDVSGITLPQGFKIYKTRDSGTAQMYANMFPNAKLSSTFEKGTKIYKVIIPKPAEGAMATEIGYDSLNHDTPNYGKSFNQREYRSMTQLYHRIVIDDFAEARNNTSDLENNSVVNPDIKIPSIADFIETGASIRTHIISKLEAIIRDVKGANVNLLERAIKDLQQPYSETFFYFTMFFSKYQNAQIIDLELMQALDGELISDAPMSKNWDEQAQLMLDPKDSITSIVKYHIAKLSRTDNTLSGVTEALNVDEVWYELHANLSDDVITLEKVINTLYTMGATQPHFADLASYLETNQNPDFTNGFISMMKLSLLEVKALTNQYIDGKETLDFTDQNRSAWGEYGIYDIVRKTIDNIYDTGNADNIIKLYTQLVDSLKAEFGDALAVTENELKTLKIGVKTYVNINLGLEKHLSGEETRLLKLDGVKELLDELFHELGIQNIHSLNDDARRQASASLIKVAEDVIKNHYAKNEERVSDRSVNGAITTAGKLLAKSGHRATKFDYINSEGNNEFSLNMPSYLTDFFRGLGHSDDAVLRDNVLEAFKDILEDARSNFSNWLWDNHDEINIHGKREALWKGIFKYTSENGKRTPVRVDGKPDLSPKYVRDTFKLIAIDGIKFIEDKYGLKSDLVTNDVYDLMALSAYIMGSTGAYGHHKSRSDSDFNRGTAYYIINQSDSPRTHAIKAPVFNVKSQIDVTEDGFSIKKKSPLMNALRNIMYQDLYEMYKARDAFFDIIDGKLVLKEEYNHKNKDNNLHLVHAKKHGTLNENGDFILLKDGKPTGKVFEFTTLNYVDGNGNMVTFADFLSTKAGYDTNVYNYLTENTFEDAQAALFELMNEYIDIAMNHRVNQDLARFESSRHKLTGYNRRESLNKTKSTELIKKGEWRSTITEFSINNFIAQSEIANMFSGANNEFNSGIESNKRVGGYIKPGQVPGYNETFTTLLVNDIFRSASKAVLDNLSKYLPSHLVDKFRSIATTDGMSLITVEHYEQRLRSLGKYYLYKDVIEAIKKDEVFEPNMYGRYMESLKFFYQDRQIRGRENKSQDKVSEAAPYNYMYTTQLKNSAIVLAPGLNRGSMLNDIYHYMSNNGINELDFNTVQKVGRQVPVTLFNEKGEFTPDVLGEGVVQKYIDTKNLSNLRLQQETRPHILDETVKQGVQISKTIFNNILADTKYHDGRTGRQIFDSLNKNMAANVKSSAMNLLNKWGAVEGGQIKTDGNGNILVDIKRINVELLDYIYKEGLDMNLLKAVQPNEDGNSTLPLWAPIHYKKLSSVILSKFTKQVIDQKLPGVHAPLVPDIGFNVAESIRGKEQVEQMRREGSITYLNRIHEEVASGKRSSYELQYTAEYKNGKLVNRIEVLLNPHLSKFIQSGQTLDINELYAMAPEALEMVGMRIPTEGKQSMVVVDVVGFLNNGATQAIFPKEMIPITGWDFDIDTIYMYYKNLDIKTNDFGGIEEISVVKSYTNEQDAARYKAWKNEYDSTRHESIYEKLLSQNIDSEVEYYRALKQALNLTRSDIRTSSTLPKSVIKKIATIEKSAIEGSLKRLPARAIAALEGMAFNTLAEYQQSLIKIHEDVYFNPIRDIYADKKANLFFAQDEITLHNLKNESTSIEAQLEYINGQLEYIDLLSIAEDTDAIVDKKKIAIQLQDEIKSINKKLSRNVDEYYRDIYDSLDEADKNTRAARENAILHDFETILLSEHHANEFNKPNEMDESSQAADIVNNIAGQGSQHVNLLFYADAANIRDMNMSVRELKANSVALDALMSVLGVVNAEMQTGITFNLTSDQVGNQTIEQIEEVVGKGNVTETDGIFTIEFKHLGNNNAKSWLDITGLKIDNQASQTTSHILDAVSVLMGFNINKHTLGVYKLMAMTTLNMMYNDGSDNPSRPNKFVLPNLFVHQPIIVDYAAAMTSSELETYTSQYRLQNELKDTYIHRVLTHPDSAKYLQMYADHVVGVDGIEANKENIIKGYKATIDKINNNIAVPKNRNEYKTLLDYVEFISNLKKGDSYTVLLDNMKDYHSGNPSIETLAYQLKHIDEFINYKTKADRLVGLNVTLNQDKKKLGPTTSDTRFMVHKVNKYNETARSEMEQVDSPAILVNGRPILESILPSHFELDTESSYPVFESYFKYGAKVAQSVFATISALDSDVMNKIKDDIIKDITSAKTAIEVDNAINSYAVFYFTEMPNILRVDDWYNGESIQQGEIELKKRLNGMMGSYAATSVQFNTIAGESIHLLNEHYDDFKKLSLTNKIALLYKSKRHSNEIFDVKHNNSHILAILELEHSRKYFEANGRTAIKVTKSDITKEFTIGSLEEMLNSNDPFFRDVALDLIRYSYINHGLNFGNNVSKFISTDIVSKSIDGNPENRLNELGTIADKLYDMRYTIDEMTSEELKRDFFKTMADNPAVVPTIKSSERRDIMRPATFNYKGNNIIYTLDHISDFQESHRMYNKPYVSFMVDGERTLFKQYIIDYQGDNYVVQFAIQKLDMFEKGYTLNEHNKESNLLPRDKDGKTVKFKPIRDAEGNIQPYYKLPTEATVDELIDVITTQDFFIEHHAEVINNQRNQTVIDSNDAGVAYATDINVTEHNSQTEAYRNLAQTYENIVYIGDQSTIEHRMFNNIKHAKFIQTSNAAQMANEIKSKNTSSRIAILGNTNALNNADMIKLARYLKLQNPKLESIGTISNSNISSIIKRVTDLKVDHYTSNENSPNSVAFSTEMGYETAEQLRSVSRQADILQTMTSNIFKLHGQYSSTSVPFAKKLANIAKELNVNDVYDRLQHESIVAMTEAINHQVEMFNKFNEHVDVQIEDLRKFDYHLWKQYTIKEQQAIVNTIKQLLDLSEVTRNVRELSVLQFDKIAEGEGMKLYAAYNNAVKRIQEAASKLQEYDGKIMGYAQNYVTAVITATSHNPNFITALNAIDVDITPSTIVANMEVMLKHNEDINVYQFWLDSAFNTGVTGVDSVLLEYAALTGDQQRQHNALIDNLVDKMAATWGNKYLLNPAEVAKGEAPRYDRAKITSNLQSVRNDRHGSFINTLFNSKTGTLRTKYNWAEYHKVVNDYMANHWQELSALEEEGLTKAQYNKRRKALWKKHDEFMSQHREVQGNPKTILTAQELAEIQTNFEQLSEFKFKEYLKRAGFTTKGMDATIPFNEASKKPRTYYKVVPKDQYLDKTYNKLTKPELEFLEVLQSIPKQLLQDVYGEYGLTEDFFPIMQPTTTSRAIKSIIGISQIKPVQTKRGINNQLYRTYEPLFTTYTNYHTIYELPYHHPTESTETYEARVLSDINARYSKSKSKLDGYTRFESIAEVQRYNKVAEETNKTKTIENMMTDPYDVMYTFINSALEHKKIMDFSSRIDILQAVMKNPEFEIWGKSKGRHVKLKGEDSNVYKRMESLRAAINNDSKITSKIDQALNLMKQQTSMTYMAFNITGGIKNIMHGFGNEIMESAAGEFTNWADLTWAMNKYPSIDLLNTIGSDYSDNIYTAIIKRFDSILELKRERGFEYNANDKRVHKILMAHNAFYFANSITEHFMQYSMLLAIAKSSRVVNGVILDFGQYAEKSRMKALKKVLSSEQMYDLKAYIAKRKDSVDKYKASDNPDYIRRWVQTRLSITDRKAVSKEVVAIEKQMKESYSSYESVFDQFELVEGRAVLKEGSAITDVDMDYFERKVHTINQSLHGIYNRIDRNKIKDTIMGDLAFQFRSWMRPNWNRYNGQRYGRSVYNEAIGSYRKGAFMSIGAYIGAPFSNAMLVSKEMDLTTQQTIELMVKNFGSFLMNAATHWDELSIQERQNARRGVQNLLNIVTYGGILSILAMLGGDKDDEEQAYLMALAIYELNATFTETAEFIPIIGWAGTLTRTKQYTMASERVVFEWLKMAKLIALYPLQDDNARRYHQGIYNKQSRLFVAAMRNTPLVRQAHKFAYIPQYTSWYKLYNPFSSLLPSTNKSQNPKSKSKRKKD